MGGRADGRTYRRTDGRTKRRTDRVTAGLDDNNLGLGPDLGLESQSFGLGLGLKTKCGSRSKSLAPSFHFKTYNFRY